MIPAAEDEWQEALSRKYMVPMIARLSNGRYALYGANRQVIAICAWDDLKYYVDDYTPPAEPERIVLVTKKSKITLTLEDLDL